MTKPKQLNKRVLVLGDLHAPFMHPDTISFLAALKAKYNPDRIISIGDEVENNAISYHESNPDLDSAGVELEKAVESLKPLYKMFPTMDILDSNHGSLVYRKAKTSLLPKAVIKEYRDILRAPKGWNWHDSLMIRLSDGQDCFFHHALSGGPLKTAKEYSVNTVFGHHHTKASIEYASTPYKLLWAAYTGCLIDKKSLAFEYNKTTLGRPVISSLVIIDGQPKIAPMVLNESGKWTRKLV